MADNINPEVRKLPAVLPRYRHPSHHHRLEYCMTEVERRTCNVCHKYMPKYEIRFFCVKCDYDMCIPCFEKLDEDNSNINGMQLTDSDIELDDVSRRLTYMSID